MAQTLSSRLLLQILGQEVETTENKKGTISAEIAADYVFGDGTTSSTMDLLWSDRRTLAASASETLDLAGSLTDSFGNTLTFVKVTAIVIRNRNTVAGDTIEVGPDPSNGFTGFFKAAADRVRCAPGVAQFPGLVVLVAPQGFTVGAGATDELQVTEIGGVNSVVYDIMVFGRSA